MTIKSEKLDKPLGIFIIMVFSIMIGMILFQLWRLGLQNPADSIVLLFTLTVTVIGGGVIVRMMMRE